MFVPVLLAVGLLGSLASCTPVAPLMERGGGSYPQCRRDNCLNAVLQHNGAPWYKAYDDCVAYQKTTVTPRAVTVTAGYEVTVTKTCGTVRGTITHTETCISTTTTDTTVTDTTYSTTYNTVATVTATTFNSDPLEKRSAAKSPVPRYAKDACKNGQYTSACQCIGAPTHTHTAPTPTKTVAPTHTVCVTATKGRVVKTTHTTSVVTSTETSYTTTTIPTTIPATTTTTVTVSPTGPVFILYDRANAAGHAVSVPAGTGTQQVQIGSSPATNWYLGADGTLYSIANSGEAAGIDISVALPYVTVRDDSASSMAAYPGLKCTLQNGFTGQGQTGNFNCTIPGYRQGFGDCDGNLVYTATMGNGLPAGQCASFTSLSLKYQVVEVASTPVATRSTERGAARNRRKRRALPEIVPEIVERPAESE